MHDEDFDHQHGADHDGESSASHGHVDLSNATKLRSIGIDIGSATTHFVVSELSVGKRDPRLAQKPEVLHRKLLFESPVTFTPFTDATTIDAEAVEQTLLDQCAAAGIDLATMDTGALICTGEAARKKNAAVISERLSAISGRFVCATAGHHLEALLGAHGSGAVGQSRDYDEPIVTLDVGGGTAKRTVAVEGAVVHTAALNAGARLIAWDGDGRVVRLEEAGAAIADDAGVDARLGATLAGRDRAAIADRMADCLVRFLGFAPFDELTSRLLLTEEPPPPLDPRSKLVIAGGLAEYFYEREYRELGDLGMLLSASLRRRLADVAPSTQILVPQNGIRATVIGAGQHSLQVSGETLWTDYRIPLPIHNVPVHGVQLDWRDLSRDGVGSVIGDVMTRVDHGGPYALSFNAAPVFGYGIVNDLAQFLGPALQAHGNGGIVLVFRHNVARVAGRILSERLPDTPLLCVDEIDVGDLDYLDIGAPQEAGFVPVVVKSLVFGSPKK